MKVNVDEAMLAEESDELNHVHSSKKEQYIGGKQKIQVAIRKMRKEVDSQYRNNKSHHSKDR